MDTTQPKHRVALQCVGTPPVRGIERAAGVSAIEIDGPIVRCTVTGSFQPLLEALRGHEVTSLMSTPAATPDHQPTETHQ